MWKKHSLAYKYLVFSITFDYYFEYLVLQLGRR